MKLRSFQSFFSLSLIVALAGGCQQAEAQRIVRSRADQTQLRAADQSAYLPLNVGNQWTYQGQGLGAELSRTIEVTGVEQIRGMAYFQLKGLRAAPGPVRINARGQLTAWDSSQGRERLWYDFAAPPGAAWTPDVDDECIGKATVVDREARVETPAGVFSPALVIRYSDNPCADAGVVEEIFAPGVGLVRREETSIAGPRVFSLVRARIHGRELQLPGLAFSLRVDRAVYTPDFFPPVGPDRGIPMIRALLTIDNGTQSPIELQFPSGQRFDLALRQTDGELVRLWSADKAFPQVLGTLKLSPGASQSFMAELPAADQDGQVAPPGRYVLEAWLTTSSGREFAASVGIEITEPVF